MTLCQSEFLDIVRLTPLISIDLVIRSGENTLLGLRSNRPARDTWFVPGGRIRKDESFADAFRRLTEVELGREVAIDSATFLGHYEHFYEDNVGGTDFSTHYVVLAYELEFSEDEDLPASQHRDWRWWSPEELLACDDVHENTKAYFRGR
ncbi:MAG: GDP-mannose mannosyl hydrolase [Acidobacteriota bacterium]